jgi:hypothetical protein
MFAATNKQTSKIILANESTTQQQQQQQQHESSITCPSTNYSTCSNKTTITTAQHILHPSTTKQHTLFDTPPTDPYQAHQPSRTPPTIPPHHLVPDTNGRLVPQVPHHIDRVTASVHRNLHRIQEGYNANQETVGKSATTTTAPTPNRPTNNNHHPRHTVNTFHNEQHDTDNISPTRSNRHTDQHCTNTGERPPQTQMQLPPQQQQHHKSGSSTQQGDNVELTASTTARAQHAKVQTRPAQTDTTADNTTKHATSNHHEPPPTTNTTANRPMEAGPQDPAAWLTSNMAEFFPNTIGAPIFGKAARPHLCRLMRAIDKREEQPPVRDPFLYERTPTAAAHNSQIIHDFGYDLEKCFATMPNTTVSPGTEFRHVDNLAHLIDRHPYWPKIKKTLTEGALPPLKAEPFEPARKLENQTQVERGNHKSAKDDKDVLHQFIEKDNKRGYAIPITIETALRIKDSRIIPMSIKNQHSIDEKGNRIEKKRPIHNQSYSNGHCPSTNDLVDGDQLTDLVYGKCLERVIHWIVATRNKHPFTAIFISKYDIDAAYRRMTSHPKTCAQTIIIDEDGIAHIYTRLTFGGKPNAAIFCEVSETATDLANEILLCEEWHPDIISGPLQNHIGEPKRENDDAPFAPSAPMAVDPTPEDHGKLDVFVDDLIAAFLDSARNIKRVPAVIPLVLC